MADKMRYGIDVSNHQGEIDWNKVAESGKTFAIMKAMYESSGKQDETFEKNYKGAELNNIDRGVYVYISSRSIIDPRKEASDLLNILNGRKLEMGIWLDLESDSLRSVCISKIVSIVRSETEVFNNAGYAVGIYCNVNWFQNVLVDDYLKMSFPFWIARYPSNDDGTIKSALSPRNMIKESIGWQYSSKGKVNGINGNVDMDVFWGCVGDRCANNGGVTSSIFVSQARKWIGKNELDGSFKEIIDEYNSQKNLPRGYRVKYTDAWCAVFISAVSIVVGATGIVPTECSCQMMINEFINIGCWQEDESVVPEEGWIIFYDWDDNGNGDNVGWSDHVGVVEYVNGNDITVIEGNISDKVGRRHIKVNSRYIRGYGVPKYASDASGGSYGSSGLIDAQIIAEQVIGGMWGNGDERKTKLEAAGYDYDEIQRIVNDILKNKKDIGTIAKEVVEGKWGNGDERKKKLELAGYDYTKVQERVNFIMAQKASNIDSVAREVIKGLWGNGAARTEALTKAGYDANMVQARVNEIMKK